MYIKAIDNSTNEIIELKVLDEQLTSITYTKNADAAQKDVEYDVTFLLPVNKDTKTRSSVSTEQEDASIRARIKLTYYFSSDKNDIKISNVSGSWECTDNQYSMTFSNRTVSVNDGRPSSFANIITKHPTGNTYSYDTGWEYVPYYPVNVNAMTGPRAFSEITASIDGMGGSYTLYTSVNISR